MASIPELKAQLKLAAKDKNDLKQRLAECKVLGGIPQGRRNDKTARILHVVIRILHVFYESDEVHVEQKQQREKSKLRSDVGDINQ